MYFVLPLARKHYFCLPTDPTSDQKAVPRNRPLQKLHFRNCFAPNKHQKTKLPPSYPQVTLPKRITRDPERAPSVHLRPQVVPLGLYGARTRRGSTYRMASGWPERWDIIGKGYKHTLPEEAKPADQFEQTTALLARWAKPHPLTRSQNRPGMRQ